MAKRGSRKRRRSVGARLILIIALILMIAGFLTRRLLLPERGLPRLHPERFGTADGPAARSISASGANRAEQLDAHDRAELDAIIRNRTRAR